MTITTHTGVPHQNPPRDAVIETHRAYLATPQHADVVEAMTDRDRRDYTFRLLDARLAFRTAVEARDRITGTTTTLPSWDWYEARFRRTTTEQHEHNLVWEATVRDVFDAQLAEARTAALSGRDQPLAWLDRAAALAEIAQCWICRGDAGTDQTRPCCHEYVCGGCTEQHDDSCAAHAAYMMED